MRLSTGPITSEQLGRCVANSKNHRSGSFLGSAFSSAKYRNSRYLIVEHVTIIDQLAYISFGDYRIMIEKNFVANDGETWLVVYSAERSLRVIHGSRSTRIPMHYMSRGDDHLAAALANMGI